MLAGGKAGRFTGPFVLTQEGVEAFQGLCNMFTSTPTLAHYNPAMPICVETDVSGYAITGVLTQPQGDPLQKHWHPVVFWS